MHDHPIRALLTERTQIQLIAEGLTNKEIAQRLKLAEGTVKGLWRRNGRSQQTSAMAPKATAPTLKKAKRVRE